jgi:capsular polysaccharide biosynthesis protein
MPKPTPRPAKPFTLEDPIAEILEAWRLWLLGALIGAILAWALFSIAPPDYRARATVVVDNNLEEAWQFFPDRQLFQFLQRETERLVQLAWSDTVMQVVASNANGIGLEDLRASVLQLSQPADGGWHFYADSADRNEAQTLASTWAQAFVDTVRAAVEVSPELQLARAELNSALFSGHDPSEEAIRQLTQQIAVLAERTKGISPFVELYVSQGDELPVGRSISLGTYLLIGSIVGALALPMWVVLRSKPNRLSK